MTRFAFPMSSLRDNSLVDNDVVDSDNGLKQQSMRAWISSSKSHEIVFGRLWG